MKRAALSVPLNIAEASGKLTEKDRKHVHSIARGSAIEWGAVLDVMAGLGFVGEAEVAAGQELLVRLVSMLTRLSW